MTERPTNQDLARHFRELLTDGFYLDPALCRVHGIDHDTALALTKAWRSDLWKAFHVINDRLDPSRVQARNRKNEAHRN